MGLIQLAAASGVLKEGRHIDGSLHSSFSKYISERKSHKCPHYSNKMWTPIQTLRVKRNGYGDAKKIINERCKICGEQREREVSFFDRRVEF